MKFINKFFITLMALSLSSTILAFCLDQTVLKADYVTAQADKSGIYTDLAKQLPKQLASGSSNPAQVQAAFERVVTPEFLQTNLDSYLHNLETAYRTGATVPPLDLTPLIPQAEALGASFTPADRAVLEKNLTISAGNVGQKSGDQSSQAASSGDNNGVSQVYHRAAQTKWLLALATVILGGLVFVSAPHHRLKALGQGFIGATFWLAIYYGFFRIAPGIATHQLQTSKDFSLGGSVSKLITLAASGVAKRLLFAGAGTLVIGGLLWLASLLMPHFGTKHGKGDDRTPLPVAFHKD